MAVGVGIDLAGNLPRELDGIATTVEREGGRIPDRATLIAKTVRAIEAAAKDPLSPEILSESRRRSVLLGKRVTVKCGDGTFRAVAMEINDRGELVVERENGETQTLFSGEVSVHGEAGS